MTKPINSLKATKILSQLGREHYEIVSLDTEVKKLSDEKRQMTFEERDGIESLKGITFSAYTKNHLDFANAMLQELTEINPKITDKQSAYLWWLVYHYRKQISNAQIISAAERNKIF